MIDTQISHYRIIEKLAAVVWESFTWPQTRAWVAPLR